MVNVPSINEWLSGKNILITGVTGFIGKGILEKLLRECPTLGNVYVILRPKRGHSVEERFQDLIDSKLFKFLGNIYDWNKVIPIAADMSVVGLGLSKQDRELLQNNVNVVYHVAATVKFNEKLTDAIKINVRITRDMIELAQGMKQLQLFVHVSTAFANMDRLLIEEKVYAPKMDWKKAIELAETSDPDQLNAFTKKILGECGNTYIFSKQLAESVVWDHRHELPVLIYRPVVVAATKKEPTSGWTDNLSGPELIIIAIGKGILRVVLLDQDIKLPSSFCDVTVNALIAATWKLTCYDKIVGAEPERIVTSDFVYQSTKEAVEMGRKLIKDEPVPDILWTDYFLPTKNRALFLLGHLLINVLPALIITLLAKAAGKKKVPLMKLMRRIYYLLDEIVYMLFTAEGQLDIKFENVYKIEAAMSEEDRMKYDVVNLRNGLRMYDILKQGLMRNLLNLLGEREISKEEGFKQQRRMVLLDRVCRVILVGLFIAYFPYNMLLSIISGVVNYVNDIFAVD